MSAPIIVPLDGSLFSEHALPTAYELVARLDCPLHLVKVHAAIGSSSVDEGGLFNSAQLDRDARIEEREYLVRMAEAARWRTGKAAQTALLDGPVTEALERYAREQGAQLVIMTTHGRGGLSRAWLGSVADELVRLLHVPVLLLRPHRGECVCDGACFKLNHVAIPLDGSELSEHIVEPAVNLGRLTGARFTLIQVILTTAPASMATVPPALDTAAKHPLAQSAHEHLEHLAADLRARGVRVETAVVAHSQVATGILDHCARIGADLIAMATHGRSGLGRLALGSVADKVLRATTVPMLMLRPKLTAARRPHAEPTARR
jgi:nucleotide-binding universal stress UspA family protein